MHLFLSNIYINASSVIASQGGITGFESLQLNWQNQPDKHRVKALGAIIGLYGRFRPVVLI